jgi:hypothetical protein
MLIEQIDDIRPESFQRSFSNFLDVFWPTISTEALISAMDLLLSHHAAIRTS